VLQVAFKHEKSLEAHSFKMTWNAYEQTLAETVAGPVSRSTRMMAAALMRSMMQSWTHMTCVMCVALMGMKTR